jgi:hypothetical protein
VPKTGHIRECVTESLFLSIDFREWVFRSIGNLTTLHPVSVLTVSSESEVPAAEFRHAVAELVFTVAINPKLYTV